MKRVISWLLAVALLLTLAMPVALAADERTSGAFTYRIKGNGTAAITGYDWSSKEIYIPRMLDGSTVTEIANSAFSTADERGYTAKDERKTVSSLVIPDTVTVIGERAFMGCDFTCVSISIPASVQHIGAGAFSDLGREFKQFTVDKNNQTYATIDGVLYNKIQKELVACPAGGDYKNTTSNPSGSEGYIAISLGSYFSGTSIPEGIISIGAYSCVGIYDDIALPSTLKNIGKYAFSYATSDRIGTSKTDYNCLELPAALSTMDEGAFYCAYDPYSRKKVVDLSKTQLTEIPSFAFAGSPMLLCRGSIASIYFPPSLGEIGEEAFAYVDFDSNRNNVAAKTHSLASTQVITIGDRAFYQASFTDYTVELPSTLKSIGAQAFYTGSGYYNLYSIDDLTLPASVTEIGDNMCNREKVVLNVEPGSYAAVWASENGYITQGAGKEDTSWLD